MDVTVDVGGRPGFDCGGFCSFCYFKGADKVEPFGCKHCSPIRRGCDYCGRMVLEMEPGYKPFDQIVYEVAQKTRGKRPDGITIKGNGDLSCYPDLLKLVRTISGGEVPVFLEYTSGKGFSSGNEADALIEAGVRKVCFSVFSTNPELRRKYMNDKHPVAVKSNLRTFCENCIVYAMAVIVPGANDGPALERTCRDLDDMGAKGLVLMTFANTREQGLIFGNGPIMPGVIPNSAEEIGRMASKFNSICDMKVAGTPLWDPNTGAPFALVHHREELQKLPSIEKSATLITSRVAYPFLSRIFQELGDNVNVLSVNMEIGNLVTLDDFAGLKTDEVKDRVIIPGSVLAHDNEIRKALRRDGKNRLVFRGPDDLSVEPERSICLTARQVLDREVEAFTGLIEMINDLGI
jgi:methanogenesis marker radical SAM protein